MNFFSSSSSFCYFFDYLPIFSFSTPVNSPILSWIDSSVSLLFLLLVSVFLLLSHNNLSLIISTRFLSTLFFHASYFLCTCLGRGLILSNICFLLAFGSFHSPCSICLLAKFALSYHEFAPFSMNYLLLITPLFLITNSIASSLSHLP
jgi:hypothetical protein